MEQQPVTPKELSELLKSLYPIYDSRDIDISTIKYALYARKSTKGEERQERSIPDQIDDCMKREVVPNQLHIVGKPIEEHWSAKEPDVRPKFRAMLDDIKAGKVDGIVAWHPDRLARNMKEAGEIIDLLDKGILKDLRFATSTFENSPTGKMLLGISFVLSKQYSEHLSESVKRGNRRKIEEGIYFDEMKHGYYISSEGKLYPDGNNFIIIKEAFEKRLEGAPQLEIARWLNTQGYTVRRKGKKPKAYTWDKDKVSKLLKDTVYTGVLKYGNNFVDLTEFYEFEPVISVEDFLRVNKVKSIQDPKLMSSITVKPRENVNADLLRGRVYCGYCNKPMSSGITTKRDPVTHKVISARYYYRCETEDCSFRNKSARAKIILDCVIDFLNAHLFTTETNYENYVAEAQEHAAVQAKALDSDIAALTRQVGNKEGEYERTKATIRDNPQLAKHYDLDEVDNELKSLKKDLGELVRNRKSLKQAILTYKQYLELFENIGVRLAQTHDILVLDELIKKFFLNFTVKVPIKGTKQGLVVTYTLNEPWQSFVKSHDFVRGRGERTRTSGLRVPNAAR